MVGGIDDPTALEEQVVARGLSGSSEHGNQKRSEEGGRAKDCDEVFHAGPFLISLRRDRQESEKRQKRKTFMNRQKKNLQY